MNISKVKMTPNVLVFGKDVEDGVNRLLIEKDMMLLQQKTAAGYVWRIIDEVG